MGPTDKKRITRIVDKYRPDLKPYESLYMHFHENPELSHVEKKTAHTIHSRLSKLKDFEIHTHIGGYGLAAVFRNGKGPTILLRADMDALPIKEETGLPYASKKRMKDDEGNEQPVMHACGHDFHVTSLLGAADLLHKARDEWGGTLVCVFQPGEEKNGGAKKMVEDGLYDKHSVPVPDIVLGAHVAPQRAGNVGTKPGPFLSASDGWKITIHGKGSHGSQPQLSCDPIVIAAYTITRLQTIVSREISLSDEAVVTVGSIQAGSADNIIPSEAVIKVNVRTLDNKVRKKVLAAVQRIVRTEAQVAGAPKEPTFEKTTSYPITPNDPETTNAILESMREHFGKSKTLELEEPLQGSEDFYELAKAIKKPACYWIYGGIDTEEWDKAAEKHATSDIPANHSAYFKPAIQPTLKTGLESYAVAALTWLKDKAEYEGTEIVLNGGVSLSDGKDLEGASNLRVRLMAGERPRQQCAVIGCGVGEYARDTHCLEP